MCVFREPGSDIVTDVPLEHIKFGAKKKIRTTTYVPGEAGYSVDANLIEQVLRTLHGGRARAGPGRRLTRSHADRRNGFATRVAKDIEKQGGPGGPGPP